MDLKVTLKSLPEWTSDSDAFNQYIFFRVQQVFFINSARQGIARLKSWILDNFVMDFEVILKSILEWIFNVFEVYFGMQFEVNLKYIPMWILDKL